jgi:hypothetical protein
MLSHPGVTSPQEDMKKFIVAHAWTRVPADKIRGQASLDVVYNLARGDTAHSDNPCAIQFPPFEKRAGESASACLLPQSAASSRSTPTSTISIGSVSFTPSYFTLLTCHEYSPSASIAISSTISEQANTSPSSTTVSSGVAGLSPLPALSSSIVPSLSTLLLTPVSSTNSILPPTSMATPPSNKRRVYVNEYDHADPNTHDKVILNVSVYPDTGAILKDNTAICMTGVDADERSGVDVKCDPIGQALHLQREQDDALRFISGAQTWKASDSRCRLVKDWYLHDPTQKDKRKRETECGFDCKIDWAIHPSIIVI